MKKKKTELDFMLDKQYEQLMKNHQEFFDKVGNKRLSDLSKEELMYVVKVILPDLGEIVSKEKEEL